jgi:hypothetical protein
MSTVSIYNSLNWCPPDLDDTAELLYEYTFSREQVILESLEICKRLNQYAVLNIYQGDIFRPTDMHSSGILSHVKINRKIVYRVDAIRYYPNILSDDYMFIKNHYGNVGVMHTGRPAIKRKNRYQILKEQV